MMKVIVSAALIAPIALFACGGKELSSGDATGKSVVPAASAQPAPPVTGTTVMTTATATIAPDAGAGGISVNDPRCASQPAVQHRGTFTADPWFGVASAADMTAKIDFGELDFAFEWAPVFSVDPTNGLTRFDQNCGMFVTFDDPNWEAKLLPNATFQVHTAVGGYGWSCSANGAGGGGGGGAVDPGAPTTLTITDVTKTSISGVVDITFDDGSPAQHFTFQAPLFTITSPDPTPSPDYSICCLK